MDDLNKLGRNLRKSKKESNDDIRREKENFPDVHRNVDSLSPLFGYHMEFPMTKHPHSASLNLFVREMIKPCEITPPDVFAGCTGKCGGFPGSDGGGGMEVYPSFESNFGGFILNPAGGIIVPITGYYNITFLNSIGGVNVDAGSFILGEIRVDGATVAQEVFTAGHGYNPPLSFTGPEFNLVATGIYIGAGSTVGGWLQESGIAFWTPSDICFLPGSSSTTIVLVGTP